VETIIEHLVKLALEEDLGERGDVTSRATIPAAQRIEALITAKSSGVIAGLDCVTAVYCQIDSEVAVAPCVKASAVKISVSPWRAGNRR